MSWYFLSSSPQIETARRRERQTIRIWHPLVQSLEDRILVYDQIIRENRWLAPSLRYRSKIWQMARISRRPDGCTCRVLPSSVTRPSAIIGARRFISSAKRSEERRVGKECRAGAWARE